MTFYGSLAQTYHSDIASKEGIAVALVEHEDGARTASPALR